MTSLVRDKQWIISSDLASKGNIEGLKFVVEAWNPDSDEARLLLALLLDILPEIEDPNTYIDLVLGIIRRAEGLVSEGTQQDAESESFPDVYLDVSSWPPEIIGQYATEIRSRSSRTLESCNDLRTFEGLSFWWFKTRGLRVDHEVGNLDLVIKILSDPRLPSSLHKWSSAFACVLQQWKNYYGFVEMTLGEFSQLAASDAIDFLLSRYESSQSDVDPLSDILLRDLTELILPYITYTGSGKVFWDHLYEFCKSHITCARILTQSWRIPKSEEAGYAKCMIRLCYTYTPSALLNVANEKTWESMEIIVNRLIDMFPPTSEDNVVPDLSGDYPYAGLLASNGSNIQLLSELVKSGKILSQCDFADSLLPIVRLRFFADEHTQFITMRRFLRSGSNKVSWKDMRSQLFWLKNTGKVFGNIPHEEIEIAFLRALMDAKEFKLLRKIYVDVPQPPLNEKLLQQEILTEFGEYFNNATNLSSKSGSLKDALSTIMILNAPLSSSSELTRAFNLVDAMDSLSRFNINKSNQGGDELLPVQIRSMEDPLDVFVVLFRNDSKAYLRHQELINAAHKLLIGLDRDEYRKQVDVRITALCVQYALEANAFPVALRLCEDALIPLHNSNNKQDTDPVMLLNYDLIYKTCYNVGCYGHQDIKRLPISILEDELSLLERTLSIIEPKNLAKVLNSWKFVDQQLRERGNEKDNERMRENNNNKNDHRHGFLASDVARALTSSASAFVDHTQQQQQQPKLQDQQDNFDDAPWKKSFLPNINSHEIKGKKDQLSNLFASGIGWAIGATPREN